MKEVKILRELWNDEVNKLIFSHLYRRVISVRNMRFGTCNVRSLYRAGWLMTVAKELLTI
jgi:hypothetical protein